MVRKICAGASGLCQISVFIRTGRFYDFVPIKLTAGPVHKPVMRLVQLLKHRVDLDVFKQTCPCLVRDEVFVLASVSSRGACASEGWAERERA